ncbi:extracellular solute-binding protein [Micromonospora sp. WMMD712]|uniref:extracellular solute-binding protein n=1 Tax=Micromonospora sp. WMMD712 TaxID=3016096 RepID=UPI00249A8685|nr:extracellular solute-binding protein [Micromonospora sp. WMMD712]WFE61180.1 extracellular solute-binding protein [Micromonospora sp. WMMD712]
MRLRRFAPVAAVALAAGLLAACGGGSEAGGDRQSVTMWIYPVVPDEATHKGFWDKQVAAFKAGHPDVDVKVEIFPWAKREESLTAAIAGGKGPDVVYLIPDQLGKFQKMIEPVDDYLPADAKADYRENVRTAVTLDGKMLGAPLLTSSNPLMCNAKVFAAAGLTEYPKTWADLLALAPKLKAKGFDATNYYADPSATLNQSFYPLLWQAGGDVFTADGTSVAFAGPEGVKALTFLKQLVDGGYVQKDLITSIPAFEQTNVAKNKVACTWQHVPADVEQFWGKENIKIFPPLSDVRSVGYGTVGSLSILKGSKAKKAAGEWITFVTAPAVASAYDVAGGYFSAKTSAGSLYPQDPVSTEMEKTLGSTTVGPLHEKSREVMGVLAPEIQAALIGKKTPEQALADAAKAADALL